VLGGELPLLEPPVRQALSVPARTVTMSEKAVAPVLSLRTIVLPVDEVSSGPKQHRNPRYKKTTHKRELAWRSIT